MTVYRFGDIELRPDARQLLVAGGAVILGPRAFDVLLALVNGGGQLVSKDQLLETVWPGLIVEENNLQVQISNLRKVLGAGAIATVPGRGYRWTLAGDGAGASIAAAIADPAVPSSLESGSTSAGISSLPTLYGRSADLAALCQLVRQNALVTLVGPGGIGKTRLAHAAAQEMRDDFGEGVRLVELASLADGHLVALTVGRALGISVSDPTTALDLTVRAVASQRLLLILDNCEHVLDAVDQVVAGLRLGAPGIHVLATSQELLRHPDEHVYRLGTLTLPTASTALQAKDAGAIQLFVARVRALEPRFEMNDANTPAIVDICRRLDGIPLAIELAAARVPLLGIEGVRDRLDERFRLLTAGSRLALRRHQTLQAALEWSYALLSQAEQTVFDRLGVFAGSFSLDSAQQLATDDMIDPWAVLEHLGALVDKSLVIAGGGSAPRYKMLETTRAFALERLARRGETMPLLRRHAEVVLSLFETFYTENLEGRPPGEHVTELGPELDNLRGAMHWASAADGDRRIAIALLGACGAAHGFLWNAGLQWEGWQWCKALKPLVDSPEVGKHRARFWLACAELGTTGSLEDASEDARRAIECYREIEDRVGQFFAWDALAFSLTASGRYSEALAAIVESERLLDASSPLRLRAIHENQAGLYFGGAGQLSEARDHLVRYLNISRQIGSSSDESTALVLIADLDVLMGHPERAVESLREPIARMRSADVNYDDGISFRNYATALMESGKLEEAETVFREAVPLSQRAYGTAGFVLYEVAWLVACRGEVGAAAKVHAYASSVYDALGRKPRPVALRIQGRLFELLAARIPAEDLLRLEQEGRALSDHQACALAFPPPSLGR